MEEIKTGDVFYITDAQTNVILKRQVLEVVDGQVKYNFRDGTIQSCPVEHFYDYHYKTLADAEANMARFRKLEIKGIELKIKLLQNKIKVLGQMRPNVIDFTGTYEEIEAEGKKRI